MPDRKPQSRKMLVLLKLKPLRALRLKEKPHQKLLKHQRWRKLLLKRRPKLLGKKTPLQRSRLKRVLRFPWRKKQKLQQKNLK